MNKALKPKYLYTAFAVVALIIFILINLNSSWLNSFTSECLPTTQYQLIYGDAGPIAVGAHGVASCPFGYYPELKWGLDTLLTGLIIIELFILTPATIAISGISIYRSYSQAKPKPKTKKRK